MPHPVSKEETKEIQAAVSLKREIVDLIDAYNLEKGEGEYIVKGKRMYFWRGIGFRLSSEDVIEVFDVTADEYKPLPNHRYLLGLIKQDVCIQLDLLKAANEKPM